MARFRSGQNRNDLILVVILWDARDTPPGAVAAGYDAFLGEIRDAIADNLQDAAPAESFTLPFSDILNDDFNLHAQMTVTSGPVTVAVLASGARH